MFHELVGNLQLIFSDKGRTRQMITTLTNKALKGILAHQHKSNAHVWTRRGDLSELPKACCGEYCLQVSTKKQGKERDIYRFQQKCARSIWSIWKQFKMMQLIRESWNWEDRFSCLLKQEHVTTQIRFWNWVCSTYLMYHYNFCFVNIFGGRKKEWQLNLECIAFWSPLMAINTLI